MRFEAIVHAIQSSTRKILNPCVDVPEPIVLKLKAQSCKNQSIPVQGTLQGKPLKANVVKYRGAWRLYLNGPMRKSANVDVGNKVSVSLQHDSAPRRESTPPAFATALAKNGKAKGAFESLAPSRRNEILRYLSNLKREDSLKRNIERTLKYLTGQEASASPTGLYRSRKISRSS